jgi:hypothetical protein
MWRYWLIKVEVGYYSSSARARCKVKTRGETGNNVRLTSSERTLLVEFDRSVFSEPRRVVVKLGFGVTKRFEDWVNLQEECMSPGGDGVCGRLDGWKI